MKMQIAFGNPRRAPKRKKGTKRGKSKIVAKRRKKTKTKSVKPKFSKVVRVAKSKKRRGKRAKNPQVTLIRKKGKIIGREYSPLNLKEKNELEKRIRRLQARVGFADPNTVKGLRKKLAAALNEGRTKFRKDKAYQKTLARYKEDADVQMTSLDTAAKGASVAKKKRKSKKAKSTKRRKKKAVKAAAPKKARKSKSRRKSGKRKGGKRRSKRVVKHASKKTKRTSKRRSRKGKRRYPKMVRHSHSKSVRHVAKGATAKFSSRKRKGGGYKISAHVGKGKRRVRISGSARVTKSGLKGKFKFNPFRSNPMKNLSATSKQVLGLDGAELTALAVGGLLVPIVNAGVSKIPGADKLVSAINGVFGAQATGSIIPILAGAALTFGGDKASGQAKQYLKLAGEGLAAAGVVGLVMGFSQKYFASMISGINYTPSMRGINYTPSLNGMGIMPQLGIMPQMNGINYTPEMHGVDFGSANYGGGGGSKEARTQNSDFGAWDSADSEAEGLMDEDNSYSSSMN